MASGTDAAEVLPACTTSLATTTWGGSRRADAAPSTIRRFAWCGMKAASSAVVTPAASSAARAVLGTVETAQRNTAGPSMRRVGRTAASVSRPFQGAEWAMASWRSPSDPQTTGPMPGSAAGPTTTAPAPSPNRKAVPRSSGSTMSVIRSEPTTTTCRLFPDRISESAVARAWPKPAQAAPTSIAPAETAPIRWATRGAAGGDCSRWDMEASSTVSTVSGGMPACASALTEAAAAIWTTVSSGEAKRRVAMPDLRRIHSSLESIASATSALPTTRAGR